MKKIVIVLICLFAINGAMKAQTFSVTGFGGYLFGDNVDFGNANAYINPSGFWAVSVEGINQMGNALELMYQQQNCQIPVTIYGTGGGVANKGKESAIISYILLNGEHYMNYGEQIQPFGGLGLGVMIASPQEGNSQSAFAWDLKLGVKIKTAGKIAFKIQAQLNSATAATGTGFWYGYPGVVYPYTTYSSIYQFGFAGGITFDFTKK